MKHTLIKLMLLPFLTAFALTACDSSTRSWDLIYKEQQELFTRTRKTFEFAADFLNASSVYDTTLSIKDKHLQLPDTLIKQLRNVGISKVTIYKNDCKTKDIRFVPDSLWDYDRFSVREIKYDKCDKRSKKGYHWIMEGSEHKHSFGQGDGWLIYSDSDRDPF